MKNTCVFKGTNCIKNNFPVSDIPERCLIVTGRNSASVSGALRDVDGILSSAGKKFIVYNGIKENPTAESCREAGKMGHDFGAGIVIGIGGGSAVDAAKAASVFALDPDLSTEDLLSPSVIKEALPVFAVPLTAGTGSEVNATAVITVSDRSGNLKKKSFTSEAVLPKYAFLDPAYLKTLGKKYTLSTAVDAFCHCYESFLSPKSTPFSEENALEGGRIMWHALVSNDFEPDGNDAAGLSQDTRLAMQEGAGCGGRAIMVTGTGFTHPLGYGLTLSYGIPHGFACGAFTGKYTEYNMRTQEGKKRIGYFAEHIGTSPELISEIIPAVSDVNLSIDGKGAAAIVKNVSGAKNFRNSPFIISDADAEDIIRSLFP